MNDYGKTRLQRIRNILANHVYSIDMILNGKTTNLEAGHELSLLLNQTDRGSHFKQDCKEAEIVFYRLADKEEEGVDNVI